MSDARVRPVCRRAQRGRPRHESQQRRSSGESRSVHLRSSSGADRVGLLQGVIHERPDRRGARLMSGEEWTVKIAKLNGALAASVTGIDWDTGLGADDIDQIETALMDHGVLAVAAAGMSPEQHVALAAHFGEL